jgi:hypothetical protein
MNWSKVFEHASPKKGATQREVLALVANLRRALTPDEVARVNAAQHNPFPANDPLHAAWHPFDPTQWVMPANRKIPPSYLSFVRHSDGGDFRNGDRLFQMWGTGLREFLLCYNVPQYMPLAVPFAFNGGGVMYLFDMRKPPDADGEYPIICAHAGCQTFDPPDAPKVANSFPEACRGRFNVERLMHGGVVLAAEQWDVWADPRPMLDECTGARKLRLFACACARRVWHLTPAEPFRAAVELAERLADGGATERRRRSQKEKCEALVHTPAWTGGAPAATNCLGSDASAAAWNGAWAAAHAEAGAGDGPAWLAVRAKQADLVREIFGNPLRPVRVEPAWLKWNNGRVPQMANRVYDERTFGDLPVLADAVEDAGCTNAELLNHLRAPREHVRGCWALDLLRGAPA